MKAMKEEVGFYERLLGPCGRRPSEDDIRDLARERKRGAKSALCKKPGTV